MLRRGLVVCVAVVVTALAGLGSAPASPSKPAGAITVSAAASLTEAFTRLGERFEARYDGTEVTFNFDSSSALVVQIQGGAPVDVFASADEANMRKLVESGEVTTEPVVFARNRLQIATKPGNPERIRTLADLAEVGTIALCAAVVPCGRYADAALADAGVMVPSDQISRGLDAKATLTAVSDGDADAAIVYVTDVKAAASSVDGVKIPASDNRVAIYPIAPLARASNAKTAKAFTRYAASPAGQKILKRYGFREP